MTWPKVIRNGIGREKAVQTTTPTSKWLPTSRKHWTTTLNRNRPLPRQRNGKEHRLLQGRLYSLGTPIKRLYTTIMASITTLVRTGIVVHADYQPNLTLARRSPAVQQHPRARRQDQVALPLEPQAVMASQWVISWWMARKLRTTTPRSKRCIGTGVPTDKSIAITVLELIAVLAYMLLRIGICIVLSALYS